jgi:hypothetical protein
MAHHSQASAPGPARAEFPDQGSAPSQSGPPATPVPTGRTAEDPSRQRSRRSAGMFLVAALNTRCTSLRYCSAARTSPSPHTSECPPRSKDRTAAHASTKVARRAASRASRDFAARSVNPSGISPRVERVGRGSGIGTKEERVSRGSSRRVNLPVQTRHYAPKRHQVSDPAQQPTQRSFSPIAPPGGCRAAACRGADRAGL